MPIPWYYIKNGEEMSGNLSEQFGKIESFLFNEYGVEVDYEQDNDNAYYHDLSLIEINTR